MTKYDLIFSNTFRQSAKIWLLAFFRKFVQFNKMAKKQLLLEKLKSISLSLPWYGLTEMIAGYWRRSYNWMANLPTRELEKKPKSKPRLLPKRTGGREQDEQGRKKRSWAREI
jgi:hypothetical protein